MSLRPYQIRFVQECARRLPLHGASVLEIGAADGQVARDLVRAGAATVVGIDKNPSSDWDRPDQDQSGVQLLEMDAHRLEFGRGEFDLVVSLATIEHLADPALAVSEAHRVLRSGGLFLARFAPIWSFATGHHYQVWLEDPAVHIPVWAHLYWTEAEMFAFLSERHGAAAAAAAVDYIYRQDAINRLPCAEYTRIFGRTSFGSIELTPLRSEGFRPFLSRTKGRLPGWETEELLVAGFEVFGRK